jgi:hypothetical protein
MRKIRKQNVTKQIVLSKALLSEAGLGRNVEIIVQDGAIFVLPAVKKRGWQLLEKLGQEAVEGKLDQPSRKHDSYLYGKRA